MSLHRKLVVSRDVVEGKSCFTVETRAMRVPSCYVAPIHVVRVSPASPGASVCCSPRTPRFHPPVGVRRVDEVILSTPRTAPVNTSF